MLRTLVLFLFLVIPLPSIYAQAVDADDIDEVIPEIDTYFRRISLDDLDGVKKSLENKNLSPNTSSKQGDAPLPYAVKENSYKVLRYLLQLPNIDVEMENKSTENVVMMLAFKGRLDLVKYVIEDLGAEIDKEGWTALHYAVTNGHYEVAQYLITKKAELDALSPTNSTPLMLAARHGHIRVVKLLLDNQADLSLRNTQNYTAIDFAYLFNQKEIGDGLRSRWKKLYGKEYVLQVKP